MNKNKTVQVLIQNVKEYFDKFGVRRANIVKNSEAKR